MAKNPKVKKDDISDPQPQPEAEPKVAETPQANASGAQTPPETRVPTEIQAEFIGTVQPKYKPEPDAALKELAEKVESGVETEAKAAYGLAKRHKITMMGLGAALVASVIIAIMLNVGLQSADSKITSLSASYNGVSAQNAQLSSQLANLSDYNTNFSRLRDKLVSLQSALNNKNITVQNLHYTITSMAQQLNNATNQLNAQNSTIFNLEVQLANLSKHVSFGYEQTLVQANTGNMNIAGGSSYQISFVPRYSGILSLNITSDFPYKVTLTGPYGTYLTQSYNSGSSIMGLPVVGTPSANLKYTLTVSNTNSQNIYGTIGAYLFN